MQVRKPLSRTLTAAVAPPRSPALSKPVSQRMQTDLAITLLSGLALLLWDASHADLWLSSFYGSPQGFAWRSSLLTAGVLHEGGRWLAALALFSLAWNVWRPLPMARGLPRIERARWLLATIACLALVPALKQHSLTSCPWDLDIFGGHSHWVSHWAAGVSDGGPGRCFPSGHASAAFAFFGGYFALREGSPGAARAWLATVLALGLAFGWAQLARGAHFASHSAWTAWVCWSLTALVFGPLRHLRHLRLRPLRGGLNPAEALPRPSRLDA